MNGFKAPHDAFLPSWSLQMTFLKLFKTILNLSSLKCFIEKISVDYWAEAPDNQVPRREATPLLFGGGFYYTYSKLITFDVISYLQKLNIIVF